MTRASTEPRTVVGAAKGLMFAALILRLGIGPVPALAGANIQMLPPVIENTATVCAAGTTRMLTWDGASALACSNELAVSGNNIGIGTTAPGALLDIYAANTGVAQSNQGALIFRAADGNYRPAIAVYGNIDDAVMPDNVAAALVVRDVNGTGRSITTTGSIAIGGPVTSSYFLGSVGIGTTNPQVMLDVQGGEIRPGNSSAACSSANAGAIRYDATVGQVEYCDSSTSSWRNFNKPKLTPTESIFCEEGIAAAGASPLCTYTGNNGGTSTYTATTTQPHDLCVLSAAGGYAGGLWGECQISGTPGSTWQLDLAAYKQVNCTITCYDFQ